MKDTWVYSNYTTPKQRRIKVDGAPGLFLESGPRNSRWVVQGTRYRDRVKDANGDFVTIKRPHPQTVKVVIGRAKSGPDDQTGFSLVAARKLAAKKLQLIQDGINPNETAIPKEPVTLARAYDYKIEHITKTGSKKSLKSYRSFRKYFTQAELRKLMRDFTIADLMLVEERVPAGSRESMGKFLKSMWNRARTHLDGEIGHPVKDGGLFKAPASHLDAAAEHREENDIKVEELPRWWTEVHNLRNPAKKGCLLFILFTGCRSEAARLIEWDHVDLERRRLKIKHAKRIKGRAAPFDIPLNDFLIDLLMETKKETRKIKSPLVFPGRKGPLSGLTTKKIHSGWSGHALRRMYTSLQGGADVPRDDGELLINHSVKGVRGKYVTRDKAWNSLVESQEKMTKHLVKLCSLERSLSAA